MRDKDGRGRKETDKTGKMLRGKGVKMIRHQEEVWRGESQGESRRSLEVGECFVNSHPLSLVVL